MGLTVSTGLSAAFQFGQALLTRLWPDPAQRAAAQLQLEQLEQTGELAKLQAETQVEVAQAGTNTAEAGSGDFFARDWRPFIGWVCGAALVYDFVARPLLAWFSGIVHIPLPPELDLSTMLPLLTAMLGVGAIQSNERIQQGKST
ncbi:MAG: 3TM-type holin [Gemmataceae bacterium]